MHHHIPICKSCKTVLDKHIQRDGGFIIQYLDALRKADSPSEISSLSERIIKHASKLVPYEDLNLKTIEPAPTSIMHRVRAQEYSDLFPKLFSESDMIAGSRKHSYSLRHVLLGAAVGVIVLGAGIVILRQKPGLRPSAPVSARQKTTVTQPLKSTVTQPLKTAVTQPLEVVSAHFRVVIMRSLLEQGPYYNILVYYTGSTPCAGLTTTWGESTSGDNSKPVKPGAEVASFDDIPFPHGFADTSPIQVRWTEQGKQYTETVRLSDAKTSLKVENHYIYSGQDAQWSVSYEKETIAGTGFSHSYAVFVITRKGKAIGSVDCVVNSPSGTEDFSLQSSNTKTMRVGVNPSQPAYDITGKHAEMTIYWDSGTAAIPLVDTSSQNKS